MNPQAVVSVEADGTIRLPGRWLSELGWTEGDDLRFDVRDGVIVMSRDDAVVSDDTDSG